MELIHWCISKLAYDLERVIFKALLWGSRLHLLMLHLRLLHLLMLYLLMLLMLLLLMLLRLMLLMLLMLHLLPLLLHLLMLWVLVLLLHLLVVHLHWLLHRLHLRHLLRLHLPSHGKTPGTKPTLCSPQFMCVHTACLQTSHGGTPEKAAEIHQV